MGTLGDAKVYRPLNFGKREIRVLEILPPDPHHGGAPVESKVAVDLNYCSLDNPVSYEALSYTWGDPHKEAIIQVGSDENFVVRQNLESALRDLRLPTERRVVWIDAICINQADLEERSEQVKLMRLIYANASVVCSWLDQEIEMSNPAIVKLHSLSEDSTVKDLGDESEFWTPVREVFTNEYWFRIWVQQEIAYASQWTVQCRISNISSKCLMTFATLMVMKIWGFYTDPLIDTLKWKAIMPTPIRSLLYRSRKDSGEVSASTFYGPLNRALRESRDLRSTDPKDKIFAMLGMIDDYRDGDIDVNYNLSDKQVYTNIVRLYIEQYHSLDFLREATLGNLRPGHESFPTWLPDWSQTSTVDLFNSPNSTLLNLRASTKMASSPPANISQEVLQTSGFRIGSVGLILPEALQERLWTGKLEIQELVAKFRYFKTLRDDIDTPIPTELTSPMSYRTEYLFRALTGADGRGTAHRRFQIYSEIFKKLISVSSFDHDDEAFKAFSAIIDMDPTHFGDLVHYMQESSRGRHFFLTTELCMGLIPQSASVGDEIWYIVGCATPITLRKENNRFVVVGEAYVNDCMQWRVVNGVLETSGGAALTDYQTQDIQVA